MVINQLFKYFVLFPLSSYIIESVYGGFWNFRCSIKHHNKISIKTEILRRYLDNKNSYIGENTQFENKPKFPHGLHGIHISDSAIIGKNCVIFQNVTIGSNTLIGSKNIGAPSIGDNVYIGAGAAVIGKVKIGNGCRIGANCIVYKDMEDNTTAVIGNIKFLHKQTINNNKYISLTKLKEQYDSDNTTTSEYRKNPRGGGK